MFDKPNTTNTLDLTRTDLDISRVGFNDGLYDNWAELRFPFLGPDRRSYHSSFIHNKK